MSRKDLQTFLSRWIANYVLQDDNADVEAKAKYPRRAASVEVDTREGNPGAYRVIAFLQPHFQLDELTISLRVVINLPDSVK